MPGFGGANRAVFTTSSRVPAIWRMPSTSISRSPAGSIDSGRRRSPTSVSRRLFEFRPDLLETVLHRLPRPVRALAQMIPGGFACLLDRRHLLIERIAAPPEFLELRFIGIPRIGHGLLGLSFEFRDFRVPLIKLRLQLPDVGISRAHDILAFVSRTSRDPAIRQRPLAIDPRQLTWAIAASSIASAAIYLGFWGQL